MPLRQRHSSNKTSQLKGMQIMKALYGILPLAMVALIASAADEPGQPNQGNQGNPPQLTEQQKQENAQKPLPDQGNQQFTYRQRMVTGQVLDTKEADVTAEGKSENHLLAKVKTYSGHVVIVDFGPKNVLKNEIKTGDEIAAFGITGRMNERPLVVASKVATIQPIQGREDIYESIPASYLQEQQQGQQQGQQQQQGEQRTGLNNGQNSNQQFTQEAIRRSNENDRRELEGFQGGQPNQQQQGVNPGQNFGQNQPQQGYTPGQNFDQQQQFNQQQQQQFNTNFDRQGFRTPCEDR